MSTIRTRAITGLISAIESDTGATGYRGIRFLHEINTFPSFYIHLREEKRVHISSANKLCLVDVDIRGYCYSDKLETVEIFTRQLENSVAQYRYQNREIEESRVYSVKTDEGLLLPYAVSDLKAQILYRIIG